MALTKQGLTVKRGGGNGGTVDPTTILWPPYIIESSETITVVDKIQMNIHDTLFLEGTLVLEDRAELSIRT